MWRSRADTSNMNNVSCIVHKSVLAAEYLQMYDCDLFDRHNTVKTECPERVYI